MISLRVISAFLCLQVTIKVKLFHEVLGFMTSDLKYLGGCIYLVIVTEQQVP